MIFTIFQISINEITIDNQVFFSIALDYMLCHNLFSQSAVTNNEL